MVGVFPLHTNARIRLLAAFLFGAALLMGTGCAIEEGDNSAPNTARIEVGQSNSKEIPVPGENAFLRPGPVGDGSFVLPNGRLVRPAGSFVATPTFPNDVGVSPDGQVAVLTTGHDHGSVCIYDVALGEITQILTEGVVATFTGIAFNAAGDRFWVSGGGSYCILEFDLFGSTAVFSRRIKTIGFPTGLVLSADEQYIYTALHMSKRMIKVRLSDGAEVASFDAHMYPYDLAITPDERIGFVSNLGRDTVSAFDLETGGEIEAIPVGNNPEGLALDPSGDLLYVANSDSDSVSVIDIASLEVVATWDLHDDEIPTMGAMPLAIEVSPDGSRLFVTCAGYDSIDVVSTADGSVEGRIPTGWYPTNAAIDPVGGRLFVANGKGVGSHGGLHDVRWPGALQVVDLPTAGELEEYTAQVEDGLRWAGNFYEDWYAAEFTSPIPTQFGVRSDQIKHVVFILKENKTYDQVLGDLEGTVGDPQYTIFGEEITANTHRLARRFTNCDNFYVEGDISVIGHLWAMFANCNDHAEKAFLAGGKYPLPDVDPATRPPSETTFKKVLDNGMEFRNYGQFIGIGHDIELYLPYTDLHYGFWNMGTSDEHQKAEEIIREWEKGLFPELIYILLPNDHNYGDRAASPTPRWCVADNDAGLGKLVDWISHSKHWDETVIFVTEDDPQSGWDHIDPHRTIGLVISPWAKRGHVSSVLYSQMSMWLTIELILGLPPSSKFDRFAAPMFDAFTMDKNSTPFSYTTNPFPFEKNRDAKHQHKLCGPPNWLVPDGAPGLSRVLWSMYKPGEPFPEAHAVERCGEENESEAEDLDFYVEGVNQAIAYAKDRGITVPVPDGWAELTRKVQAKKKNK